jgi:hypothetical protein
MKQRHGVLIIRLDDYQEAPDVLPCAGLQRRHLAWKTYGPCLYREAGPIFKNLALTTVASGAARSITGTFWALPSSMAVGMEGAMIKLPDKMLRDEAEMRAFYQSVGISPETIELAIVARRHKPAVEGEPPAPLPKGRRRKTAAPPK